MPAHYGDNMFCPNDGIENREGAKRCKKCGACLNCGEKDPGEEICRKCRVPLSDTGLRQCPRGHTLPQGSDNCDICEGSSARSAPGNMCPRGSHFMAPSWEECLFCRSEDAPLQLGGSITSNRTRIVPLGNAPDGLPFRLFIDSGPSASELLEPLAQRLDTGARAIEEIRNRVDDLLYQQRVRTIQAGDQELQFFISAQPARVIFGATLLERVFGERSGRRRANTAVGGLRQPTSEVASRTAVRRVGVGHLAVPVEGGDPIVVTRTESAVVYNHLYEPETLESFTSARLEIHVASQGLHYAGPMKDLDAYREARASAFAAGVTTPPQCAVDRNEVALLIADLARQIERLHQRGEVHGDVKPANTLVTKSGVVQIDSLQMKPTQYSPAMTPGWSCAGASHWRTGILRH